MGVVTTVVVRMKDGNRKNWALVGFQDAFAAALACEAGCAEVRDELGLPVTLVVRQVPPSPMHDLPPHALCGGSQWAEGLRLVRLVLAGGAGQPEGAAEQTAVHRAAARGAQSGAQVTEATLQYRLFTPEIQWQSRGKGPILQG